MDLSPQEQAELDQLRKEQGNLRQPMMTGQEEAQVTQAQQNQSQQPSLSQLLGGLGESAATGVSKFGGQIMPGAENLMGYRQAAIDTNSPSAQFAVSRPEASGMDLSDLGTNEFQAAKEKAQGDIEGVQAQHPTSALVGNVGGMLAGVGATPTKARVLAKGIGNLAEKTGLARIPDYLMQAAVGTKNFEKGMGTEMLNQGILRPTQNMMAKQASKKIPGMANELTSVVEKLPGEIEHSGVAQGIEDKASHYVTSGGDVPSSVEPEVSLINKRAQEVAQRSGKSPVEGLEYKRIAGREGYKQGSPTAGLEKELARTESKGYGKQLEALHEKAYPGEPNRVTDLNRAQEAMYKVQRGANRGGDITSIAGLLRGVNHILPTSGAMALGAHALQKGGQAAANLVQPAALNIAKQSAPTLIDMLRPQVSPDRQQASALSPEDQAELDQLRKEQGH